MKKSTNVVPVITEYVELPCDKCGKPSAFSHKLNWWHQFLQSFFHSEYGGKFQRHYHVHYCTDKNCNHRQLERQAYPRMEMRVSLTPTSGVTIASEHVQSPF